MRRDGLTWAIGGLVLLSLACQISELPHVRTLRGDETYYIQAAHEMMQSGDWITPRYESGALRFQKPILTYWLVGGAMRLCGIGLAAARLPALLLALATLPFVYGLARLLLRDRAAALFAVAAHVSAEVVYSNAHQARTDTILAFFIAAAMYFFARLIFEPGHERRDVVLAYAGVAGATLTKGLAGVGFVLLPVAVFLLVSWRRKGRGRWRAVASPWGWAVLLLLIAPWFGLMLARYGRAFTNTFFGDQVGIRIAGGKGYLLLNPIEYLWLLFKSCLPWSIVIALGLLTNDGGVRGKLAKQRDEWTFLAAWFAVTLLIILGANITRGRYLLTVMPIFSLLAGQLLSGLGAEGPPPRGARWGLWVLAAGGVVAGVVCIAHFALLAWAGVGGASVQPVIGAILACGGVLMAVFIRKRLLRWAALYGAAVMVLAMASFDAFLLRPESTEAAAGLAREVVASQPDEVQIVTVGLSKHDRAAVLLYGRRRVDEWTDATDFPAQIVFLHDLLRRPGGKLILLDDKDYTALPDSIRQRLRIVASRSYYHDLVENFLRGKAKDRDALLEMSKSTIHAAAVRPS
ncbi:MAG: phospholipid carrier-dependent glycosyltransferase [Planctomycetes bacterium]|nr:phospholipid carrier-dependent glycosyltransferase [Planctomycetota bacterium]